MIIDNNKVIVVPCVTTFEFIKLKKLIRCEGAKNFTKMYFTDGSIVEATINIGKVKLFLQTEPFFMCHKSHLINTLEIKKYYKEGIIKMSDNSKVPVSRRLKEQFFNNVVYSGKFLPLI